MSITIESLSEQFSKSLIITKQINSIIKIQRTFRIHNKYKKLYPYEKIKYYYEKYLKNKGCILPKQESGLGRALECLYLNIRKEISIEDLRKYVEEKGVNLKGGSDTLQVRHLGLQKGFNLLKGLDNFRDTKVKKSHYILLNLKDIFNGFCKEKRTEKLNNENWLALKTEYGFKCVNCGSEENKPLRWNGNKLTILQQGHMDPRKPLSLDNVIPQCSICNQQYKNKAIFNKRGFVIGYKEEGF
jgi:hypothetical protein